MNQSAFVGRFSPNPFVPTEQQIVYTDEQLAQQCASRAPTNAITVRITNNYGARAVYPVCETAHKLADLVGTKTFTPAALKKIEALGYAIAVQPVTL
jgi:hypothetical protein